MQPNNRKPNRLKYFDYSNNGYYFLTICVKDKKNVFGNIGNEKMFLNDYGNIAEKFWVEIPNHFEYIKLDEFIIMPNHIHGILIIDIPVGNRHACSSNNENVGNNENNGNNGNVVGNNDRCSLQYKKRNMELLPKIISQYKSSVTREIHKKFNNYDFVWQKSFYDHIIRSEISLNNIREYIRNNPLKWEL